MLQSTPLHIAADGGPEEAAFGSPAVALLLLDKGANVSRMSTIGHMSASLHVA